MRYRILLLTVLLLAAATASAVSPQTPLRFGVHPYLPPSELTARFGPFAGALESFLEKPVELIVSRDYDAHLRAAGEGRLDMAFFGPAGYVHLVEAYGPRPLLARFDLNGRVDFRGVVVVREESSVVRLRDLAGARLAFGDRHSTMSHLVPRAMLAGVGVDLHDVARYEHLANHVNVALGVLMGDFDGGAIKEEVFEKFQNRGLRAVAFSPPVPEHLFVASDGLDEETVQRLRTHLLKMGSTGEGRRVLGRIKPGLTGLAPVRNEDYDGLRRILGGLPGEARP